MAVEGTDRCRAMTQGETVPIATYGGGGGRMRKRLMVAALLAIAAIVAAIQTGGSQARVSGAGASAAPSGTVTLNGWQTSPAEETKLAKVVSDFEASHPNIKVNYTSITGDYQAAMLAKFAARKPADVFYVDAADFADWVRQGVEVQDEAVLQEPPEHVQVPGPLLRVPEGLVLAGNGGQHTVAGEQPDP